MRSQARNAVIEGSGAICGAAARAGGEGAAGRGGGDARGPSISAVTRAVIAVSFFVDSASGCEIGGATFASDAIGTSGERCIAGRAAGRGGCCKGASTVAVVTGVADGVDGLGGCGGAVP